ncbi:DUF4352 domain-containing protein [Oceanobacillus picturae]|uniref:DUF4352 domain-containing protein n=1 Tax=Oceanobacillus picturae TaxID=171693 RepID=UPI0036427CEA
MKYLCFSIVLLLGLLLTACNEEEQQNITENDDVSEGTSESEIGSDEQEDGSDDGTTGETKNGEEGISAEDQLGLKIGDTATVENNYTEFEVTLDAIEVTEEAGETPSEQGNYVILDLTVKNLSDEPLKGVDAFGSTSLETKENSSGFTWFYIDGVVEAWDSEIAPGDTQSGSLLFDVAKSEEYILTMGQNLEGLSNYVTFEFSPEEAK